MKIIDAEHRDSPSRRARHHRIVRRVLPGLVATAALGSSVVAVTGTAHARPVCPIEGAARRVASGLCGPDEPDDPGDPGDPDPDPGPPPAPPATLLPTYVGGLSGNYDSRGSAVLRFSGPP